MRFGAHMQSRRNPGQRHGRFLPQDFGDSNLLNNSFGALQQVRVGPAQPRQFGFDALQSFLLAGLTDFFSTIFRPGLYLAQEFFAEFLAARHTSLSLAGRHSTRPSNSLRPAGLSFAIPCSPSKRLTVNHTGGGRRAIAAEARDQRESSWLPVGLTPLVELSISSNWAGPILAPVDFIVGEDGKTPWFGTLARQVEFSLRWLADLRLRGSMNLFQRDHQKLIPIGNSLHSKARPPTDCPAAPKRLIRCYIFLRCPHHK
jgi:hypothetical protein